MQDFDPVSQTLRQIEREWRRTVAPFEEIRRATDALRLPDLNQLGGRIPELDLAGAPSDVWREKSGAMSSAAARNQEALAAMRPELPTNHVAKALRDQRDQLGTQAVQKQLMLENPFQTLEEEIARSRARVESSRSELLAAVELQIERWTRLPELEIPRPWVDFPNMEPWEGLRESWQSTGEMVRLLREQVVASWSWPAELGAAAVFDTWAQVQLWRSFGIGEPAESEELEAEAYFREAGEDLEEEVERRLNIVLPGTLHSYVAAREGVRSGDPGTAVGAHARKVVEELVDRLAPRDQVKAWAESRPEYQPDREGAGPPWRARFAFLCEKARFIQGLPFLLDDVKAAHGIWKDINAGLHQLGPWPASKAQILWHRCNGLLHLLLLLAERADAPE